MKKFIAVFLAVGLIGQNAYAVEYSHNKETNVITVSGCLEDGEKTNLVSIDVQNEDGDTVYMAFVPTDTGVFDYSFELPDSYKTGKYNIIIDSSESNVTMSDFYVSTEDVNGIVTGLNTSEDNNSVINVINSYSDALEISDRWLEILTDEDMVTIAEELFINKPYENKDIPNIKNAIRNIISKFAFMRAENESDISNAIGEFSDIYAMEINTKFYKEYSTLDVETKNYANKLMASNADEFDELYKIFDVSMLLTLMSNAKQPSDVIRLIDENRDIISFDLSVYDKLEKTALARKLNMKSFNSLSELETAIKLAKDEMSSVTNNGSYGGGGSSGGKKNAGSGYIISIPPQKDDSSTNAIEENAYEKKFDDIECVEWAKNAINTLAEKGILSGVDERNFAPLDYLTREQFVAMLVRTFEIPNCEEKMVFSDLTEKHWAYENINAAYMKGIVKGIGNNAFGIGQNIKRQDIAVMAVNAMEMAGYNIEEIRDVNISDFDKLPEYSKYSVEKMYSSGILNGYSDGTFRGNEYATRAEAAQIMYNILQKGGIKDEK